MERWFIQLSDDAQISILKNWPLRLVLCSRVTYSSLTCSKLSLLASSLSKMMSLSESLSGGLCANTEAGQRRTHSSSSHTASQQQNLTGRRDRRRPPLPPRRWSLQRCIWRWTISPERCSTPRSWRGPAEARRPRCRPSDPVRSGALEPGVARGCWASRSCRWSRLRSPASRAARSRRYNNARCSRDWVATAASPRLWSAGTVCWPGSPGSASPRNNSRPAYSGPERDKHRRKENRVTPEHRRSRNNTGIKQYIVWVKIISFL